MSEGDQDVISIVASWDGDFLEEQDTEVQEVTQETGPSSEIASETKVTPPSSSVRALMELAGLLGRRRGIGVSAVSAGGLHHSAPGASAPQCLRLDTCGTLGSSVPRCLRSSVSQLPQCATASTPQCLPDIGGFVPRCSIASVLQHPLCLESYTSWSFDALSGTFGATLPQSLSTQVLRCPKCLEDSTPLRFDALVALSSAHCALGGPGAPARHSLGTSRPSGQEEIEKRGPGEGYCRVKGPNVPNRQQVPPAPAPAPPAPAPEHTPASPVVAAEFDQQDVVMSEEEQDALSLAGSWDEKSFLQTETQDPDLTQEDKSSWQHPASASSVFKRAAALASMEGAEAVWLAQYPLVDSTIAALVRAPPVGGLSKDPVCHNGQCRIMCWQPLAALCLG
ncbi:UNVERIFIED_CONTAM: hypothetical protein FKN15_002501 [Acipenser sinensis]